MVSSVLAQAILGQQAPDIVGSFERGREKTRQTDIRRLSGLAARGEEGALDELAGIAPEVAFQIAETIGARDASDIDQFIKSAGITRRMLEGGNVQGAISFARQRRNMIARRGGNTQQTDTILQLLETGNVDQALNELIAFDDSIAQAKGLTSKQKEFEQFQTLPEGAEKEAFGQLIGVKGAAGEGVEVKSSLILPDGTTVQSLKGGGTKVFSPEGAELEDKDRGKAIVKAQRFGAEIQGLRSGERKTAEASVNIAVKAFDKLPAIAKSINNIDDAIRAIDEGAATGVVQSFLPSIRAASVRLDNVRNRLGLDVVGSVTFGALSESELALALSTGLPTKLAPADLKAWLVQKRDVQEKLRAGLEEAAIFLMKPGNTVADLVDLRASEREAGGVQQPEQQGTEQNVEVDF